MIYKGFLKIDEFRCLKCGDYYLIESIESDFKIGDIVFVSYYITDKEVTEEEVKEAFILKTFGGNVDELEFVLNAHSEWTIFDIKENLLIGGHDLFNELKNFEDKFLTLIIEVKQ